MLLDKLAGIQTQPSGKTMDFVFIGAIVAFFALVAAMAGGCDQLGGQP